MEILNTKHLFLLPLRPLELQMRLSSPEQLERLLNLRFAQKDMPGKGLHPWPAGRWGAVTSGQFLPPPQKKTFPRKKF